jgi:hypothetical protein
MRKRLFSAVGIVGLVLGMGGTVVASTSPSPTAIRLASVFGDTLSGSGAWGLRVLNNSTAGGAYGVVGRMQSAAAAFGSAGVAGTNAGTNTNAYGVYGRGTNGPGVHGESSQGIGVQGLHTATSGSAAGVRGETRSASINSVGVRGDVTSATPASSAAGVRGEIITGGSANGYGVWGRHPGGGTGVFGESTNANTSSGYGVVGRHAGSGSGVLGEVANAATFGGYGVYGRHAGNGYGVRAEGVGTSSSGLWASGGFYGALTYATQTGSTALYGSGISRGVDAYAELTDGFSVGVFGDADAINGGHGVYGRADGSSGTNYGVRGEVYSQDGYGGFFQNFATGNAGTGVQGQSSGATGATISTGYFAGGVEGIGGNGVIGLADRSFGYGVLGIQGTGTYAGYFDGDVRVAGTLSKSAGSFKIDHPLDPANRYLSHSFVESPDMKNIYDGVATLDGSGAATVTLPTYFGALNKDVRYQLTAIGGAAPNLHIAQEVTNNQFRIAGGVAGMKVSWQITGIRQDAYANANRIPVEEMKPASERGTLLNPAAFGQPASRAEGVQATGQPAAATSANVRAPADTQVRRPR